MKAIIRGAALAGLCVALPALASDALDRRMEQYRARAAQAGQTLEWHGARYLVLPGTERIGSEAMCHVIRDGAGSGQVMTLAERRARCDEMVALMARSVEAGPKARYAPERRGEYRGGSEEVYAQRHGRYRVLSGGARLLLDERGEISEAFLTFEIEDFPVFQAKPEAALARAARRAVPSPILGKPRQPEFLIDPNGDAPARLVYFVTFPVRNHGHLSGWSVNVDAVTGKVLYSSSTDRNVTSGAFEAAP